jgi:predicted Zn finger-like uncharacterized protein
MALATQCPHCNTIFRVASDQLKLRGGIVRCGACSEVFDGNAALIDLDAVTAQRPGELEAAAPAAAEAQVLAPSQPEPEAAAQSAPEPSASAAFDAEMAAIDAQQAKADETIYTLDFDTTFDPFGILPKPAEAEPEPEPEPEPAIEAAALPAQEEAIQPVMDPPSLLRDDAAQLHGPLLMRASADAEPSDPAQAELSMAEPLPVQSKDAKRKQARRERLDAAAAAAPLPEPDIDEPEFVRQARAKEQSSHGRRIAIGAASALLLLALAAQGAFTFRNALAARFPQLKPALESACAMLGCRIELPAQIETLSIETGELQTLGGATFSLTTLLRNQGSLAQAWPHIELTLTDANDKALVRRVVTPREYLPPGTLQARGFAPRSEQPVKLYFELSQLKASGYRIAVFYP